MSRKDCHVVDEEVEPVKIVASFETVPECERWIEAQMSSSRDKVERGGFGIDCPEYKLNSN